MSDIVSVIERHRARNGELLDQIVSKGADPNLPRDIDLHFWASTEKGARSLSAALEERGYSPVSMNRAVAESSLWNVEARVQTSPASITARACVEDLARLAEAHDSEFDGWGTSI